jgi:diadenosine tetraphosphate (Ap4A) HIT family hydrolase
MKLGDNSEWFLHKAIEHPRINTKPDGYNHGLNDGRAAGRTVDHLHWHIIPRYDGDMADPRGGVRYVIPEMGNYKISR